MIIEVNNQQLLADQCRCKAVPARQALGKLHAEEKSTLKGKLLAGITKPFSVLAKEIFHLLYQNSETQIQHNMRLAAAKWVYFSLHSVSHDVRYLFVCSIPERCLQRGGQAGGDSGSGAVLAPCLQLHG